MSLPICSSITYCVSKLIINSYQPRLYQLYQVVYTLQEMSMQGSNYKILIVKNTWHASIIIWIWPFLYNTYSGRPPKKMFQKPSSSFQHSLKETKFNESIFEKFKSAATAASAACRELLSKLLLDYSTRNNIHSNSHTIQIRILAKRWKQDLLFLGNSI